MDEKLTDSVTPLPWTLEKQVLPQHTDYAGVMWHGSYVNWLEEARVEALDAAGLRYAEMTASHVDMPVVSLKIEYRQALRHGDRIRLESVFGERAGVRWPWHSRFLMGGRLMAEAWIDLVMLHRGRVLRHAPGPMAAALERLREGPKNP